MTMKHYFTFENIFDDRVVVGIGPAGTNNPENIEQSSSGISDDPSWIFFSDLNDASSGVRRAVDEDVEVSNAWRVSKLPAVVDLLGDVELDDKLLEDVVLDVEERLLDRKLFAVTGIASAVSKHLKQKKIEYIFARIS